MDSRKVKEAAMEEQIQYFSCNRFRITLKPRREGLHAENYRNHSAKQRKEKGEDEKFWSYEDLVGFIPDLEIKNMAGHDIYITPISDKLHYLVVDDLSPEKMKLMLGDGYSPALVQQSSQNNQQAILLVRKIEQSTVEQSAANTVVASLNNRYGDPKFTGVVHL